MPKAMDLTGMRSGRLVAIEDVGKSRQGKRLWKCICDCGCEIVTISVSLANGKTRSCGCLHRDVVSEIARNGNRERFATHGLTGTPEHQVWLSMIKRCRNLRSVQYPDYGGRGIAVCDRWSESFESFLEDMGTRPTSKHTIDRIDNDGNYEPGNCRWATMTEQARNRRSNRLFEIGGEVKCLVEWCEQFRVNYPAVWFRLRGGQTIEQALRISV